MTNVTMTTLQDLHPSTRKSIFAKHLVGLSSKVIVLKDSRGRTEGTATVTHARTTGSRSLLVHLQVHSSVSPSREDEVRCALRSEVKKSFDRLHRAYTWVNI